MTWDSNYVDIANTIHSIIFEDYKSSVKDLELVGSKVESMEVAKMEEMLVNYGLSVERSAKLGKLMVSYNKIKTKRSLTSSEKDVLTGMTFDKASSVLVNEGYEALIEKAS